MRPSVAVVVEHAWHRVPGGTGTAVDASISAMVARGDVELIGHAAAHRSPPPTEIGIPAHRSVLPRPLLYEAWHRLGWPPLRSACDVIWAPAMAVPPADRPLVVTVHDLDFLEHPDRLSSRGKRFFPRAWRAAVERADRLVVPSRTVRAKMIERSVDPDRIQVVPWGVDSGMPTPDEQQRVRRQLGLPERFVLWVGTAEPRKNLDGLVAAMQTPELSSLPLVVVGPEGWGVDRSAVVAPLGRRAIVVGLLDRADLLAVYAQATVFAFPSFDEGFGLPVLEAMARGAPVVTSRGTATEEAAGGAAVLIDPHDTDSMAGEIAALVDDDARREELAALGRARAREATWDHTAAGYVSIFRQLAGVER